MVAPVKKQRSPVSVPAVTNWDFSRVVVESEECIACGRALLRGERIACGECKSLAEEALTNPVARAKLFAMRDAD